MKNLCLQSISATELVGLPASDWICVFTEPSQRRPSVFLYDAKTILKYDLTSEQVNMQSLLISEHNVTAKLPKLLLQVTSRFELDIPADNLEVVGFTFAALLNRLYVALSSGEVVTLEDDEVYI